MYHSHHHFHIPVMGTGHSIDTALRVAKYGISSVISLVDDLLIERVRKHYAAVNGLPYEAIGPQAPDARARRITAYLDLVREVVDRQIAEIRSLPFEAGNDKAKYFELLPDHSPARKLYQDYLGMMDGPEKAELARELTALIVPGSIDCNIMTKLDRINYDREGHVMSMEHSDAKAALRGFARSSLRANMVFSAGINPTLYGYLEEFPDFYRDDSGDVKKGVILKVSDFRSSLIQGKFLAKKGIEVREFRIESGLNCGGHAFASDGYLMGPILQEFQDNRDRFPAIFEPLIQAYYAKRGRAYHASGKDRRILITAQGGIGNYAETQRLREAYGLDATGWASPFLLVPEATGLDQATRLKLAAAKEEDLYLSDVSPLGVVFNNLRDSSSEQWTRKQIDKGNPGSGCPKGYLVSNTEFTEQPICTASKEYQKAKLASLGHEAPPPADSADPVIQGVYVKTCICDQLGNGVLINLGVVSANLPVSVCPGPNIAYFDRLYTLREMVNHIYGRGKSLVPDDRPHMFAKDLKMSVEYFEKLLGKADPADAKATDYLRTFKTNLEAGLEYYRQFLRAPAYPGENLGSLAREVERSAQRLRARWAEFLPESSAGAFATAS